MCQNEEFISEQTGLVSVVIVTATSGPQRSKVQPSLTVDRDTCEQRKKIK